jgi:hypothetical protein
MNQMKGVAFMDIRTIWTIPIVLILATGLPTALAAHTHSHTHIHSHTQTHSPAYLYGFGLGKNAALRGYYDVMNDCSNRLSTNVTGNITVAINNLTSLQEVDDCDSGYDHGWNTVIQNPSRK